MPIRIYDNGETFDLSISLIFASHGVQTFVQMIDSRHNNHFQF